jgi:hypothetical protein
VFMWFDANDVRAWRLATPRGIRCVPSGRPDVQEACVRNDRQYLKQLGTWYLVDRTNRFGFDVPGVDNEPYKAGKLEPGPTVGDVGMLGNLPR